MPSKKKSAAKKGTAPVQKHAKSSKPTAKKAVAGKKAVTKSATAKGTKPVAKKAAKKAIAGTKAPKRTIAKTTKVTTKKTTAKAKTVTKKATVDTKAKPKKAAVQKPEVTPAKKAAPAKTIPPVHAPVTKKAETHAPAAKNGSKSAVKPVVVPVKKSVAEKEKKNTASTSGGKFIYRPEPSVLDQLPDNTPRKRYSDNELQEFKELIFKKLEAARKELVYLQGLITRKDEAGTEDTENKYMSMEDGGGTMEREQLSQLASRQIQYIDHLEKALVRIENKTYGICRVTGKLIDKARLRAVPHATLSMEAKQKMAR